MLDVKEAVQVAKNAAVDFLADDTELQELLLEEVELDDAHNLWLITLGFNVPDKSPLHGLGAALSGRSPFTRKYKVFSVDSETGKVKAMKIRTV